MRFKNTKLSDIKFEKVNGYLTRPNINGISVYKDTVFIAAGTSGVDVYKVLANGTMQQSSYIDFPANFLITDVKVDMGKNKIYVLD